MDRTEIRKKLFEAYGQKWSKILAERTERSRVLIRRVMANDMPDRSGIVNAAIKMLNDYNDEQRKVKEQLMELLK